MLHIKMYLTVNKNCATHSTVVLTVKKPLDYDKILFINQSQKRSDTFWNIFNLYMRADNIEERLFINFTLKSSLALNKMRYFNYRKKKTADLSRI